MKPLSKYGNHWQLSVGVMLLAILLIGNGQRAIASSMAGDCGPQSSIVPRDKVANAVIGLKNPLMFALKTDQKHRVGHVTITNVWEDSQHKLLFKYYITTQAMGVKNIAVSVGTGFITLPHTANHRPDVDKFAYQFSPDKPTQAFSVSIPIDDQYIIGEFNAVCGEMLTVSSQVTLIAIPHDNADKHHTDHSSTVFAKTAWADGDPTDDISRYVVIKLPCMPCLPGLVDIDKQAIIITEDEIAESVNAHVHQ